jgi:hypothetical protein
VDLFGGFSRAAKRLFRSRLAPLRRWRTPARFGLFVTPFGYAVTGIVKNAARSSRNLPGRCTSDSTEVSSSMAEVEKLAWITVCSFVWRAISMLTKIGTRSGKKENNMHYANGRVPRVGDLVQGRGYNVKHEIVGRLITVRIQDTACNCTVAYVGMHSVVRFISYVAPEDGGWLSSSDVEVTASLEYGQLNAFVAIDPKTGEVLPPQFLEKSLDK